ncbi:MAG: uroporphyrinogen decarboxylase family protein [Pirellulaceae bacterium]|nr:uroporphyrinogen decarboxylase family protein [Pirellulaceae bacterium]
MSATIAGSLTSRQRLQATLNHQQPDRVCVDFGATPVTGIHVSAVMRLRQAVLGQTDSRVKVIEPYQMLGEVDDELRSELGIDVIGIPGRKTLFGTVSGNWKPFTMNDGTQVLVSGDFNVTKDEAGDTYIYPEGDMSVPPSGRMPAGGYFFDAVIRQDPIDEDKLNPEDNVEEFGLLSEEDLAYYRSMRQWLLEHPDCGAMLVVPGAAFGDIALVPATFLKHPKGIRDVEEWYISTVTRKDYVRTVFERQCEIAEQNIAMLIDLFGDLVDAAMITGTDFGTQRGPFISKAAYRDLFQPFHKRVNALIHAKSKWKTFIHSCGSVYQLIPDFIESGFDILNPVQCSAAEMDPVRLKREFGKDVTFWGGGVDTQQTISFGTPQEVYDEVRQRIDIFNENGGFVFNSIHNIQGPTPTENMLALFRAVRDSAK